MGDLMIFQTDLSSEQGKSGKRGGRGCYGSNKSGSTSPYNWAWDGWNIPDVKVVKSSLVATTTCSET
jgi:hypothetical protein